MKRYNGKNGYPEMEEASDGHWVTYHDHNLALLDANKSAERKWESTCCTVDKIRTGYQEELEKQGLTITYLSIGLFVAVSVILFLIVG